MPSVVDDEVVAVEDLCGSAIAEDGFELFAVQADDALNFFKRHPQYGMPTP